MNFRYPTTVFPVTTGTAANALALATLVPPYGAVYAHDEAHVLRDECGAPEFFGGGLRLVSLPGDGARIDAATLEHALDAHPPSVHTVQPAAVTITQATELGRVYRPDGIAALAALAHARGLFVHMDGARIATRQTLAEPADITGGARRVIRCGKTAGRRRGGRSSPRSRARLGPRARTLLSIRSPPPSCFILAATPRTPIAGAGDRRAAQR